MIIPSFFIENTKGIVESVNMEYNSDSIHSIDYTNGLTRTCLDYGDKTDLEQFIEDVQNYNNFLSE